MNPKALVLMWFLTLTTVTLLVAGIALWWVALVVTGLYVLYAIVV